LANICKFSISSFCAVVNRSPNFQIITAPALSPHAKIFGLEEKKNFKDHLQKLNFLRFIIKF